MAADPFSPVEPFTPAEPLTPAAEHYNVAAYYREVNRAARRAYAGEALRVGMRAPEFRLPTLDGQAADLSELLRDGHVVLVFGCYSAPPCVRELPEIDRLAAQQLPGFRMIFIYTREIHPDENLPQGRFPSHRTMNDKVTAARMLQRDLGVQMTVAIDDLAGTVHLAYGGLPFCAVIVRQRRHGRAPGGVGERQPARVRHGQPVRRRPPPRRGRDAEAVAERDALEHGAARQEALAKIGAQLRVCPWCRL